MTTTHFSVQTARNPDGVPNYGGLPQDNQEQVWSLNNTLYKVMEVAFGVLCLTGAAGAMLTFIVTENPLALIAGVGLGFAAMYYLESGLDNTPFRINNIFHIDNRPYGTDRVQVGTGGRVQEPRRETRNQYPYAPFNNQRPPQFTQPRPNFTPPTISFQQNPVEERIRVQNHTQTPVPQINIIPPPQYTLPNQERRVHPGNRQQEIPEFRSPLSRNNETPQQERRDESRITPGNKQQVPTQPYQFTNTEETSRVKVGSKTQVQTPQQIPTPTLVSVTPTAPRESVVEESSQRVQVNSHRQETQQTPEIQNTETRIQVKKKK